MKRKKENWRRKKFDSIIVIVIIFIVVDATVWVVYVWVR